MRNLNRLDPLFLDRRGRHLSALLGMLKCPSPTKNTLSHDHRAWGLQE
jgi:hypothetical protein